jgi:O-antigen/teichoic acid export membrane protein
MSVGRRAVRGAVWVAAASWINRLLVIAVLAVLATKLGPRDFGLLSVAALVSNILILFNDLGFGEAVVYESDQPVAAAETALLVSTGVGIALAVVLLVAAPLFAAFFHVPGSSAIFRAYAIVVICNGLAQGPQSLLTRDLAFGRRFIPHTIPNILGSTLTIVLAFGGVGVWSLVFGDIARGAAEAILSFAVLQKRILPRWHSEIVSRLWRFSRAALAGYGMEFALQNVDYLLVGRMLGPVALGLYTLAFRAAIFPFLTVTGVIAGVAFPAFARVSSFADRLRSAFRVTVRTAMVAVCLLAGALVALAPSLTLLGEKWAPAVPVARLLGLYVCFRSAAFLVTPLLQGIGRPGTLVWIRGLWVALLTVAILILGHRGVVAVAAIQIAVAAALFVVSGLAIRRMAGIPLPEFFSDALRPAVALGVGIAAVAAGSHLWPGRGDPTFGRTVVLGIVFVGSYGVAAMAACPTLLADFRELRSRLAR